MAKKKTSTASALKTADVKHYIDTEKYVKAVDALYGKAIDDLAELAVKLGIPTDGTDFSFSKHSGASDEVKKVLERLTARITSVVESGNRAEWLAACAKSNQFIDSILNTSKLTKTTLQKYQDRNLEALAQFQTRKVEGLGLSERVWKYVAPLETEVEMTASTKYYKHGINSGKSMTKFDRAIGEGTSAAEFSREIRSCLKEPNKLFRRVRDKYGNLTLSKAAKLYHPGQGVYRSSYKNAMRMTRSEINLAYRQSDSMRWQQLDFVVGIEVQTSNNHTTLNPKGKGTIPLTDMCDELAGKYPKDFKFVGWHPQCRCFATPILKSLKEVEESYDENGAYKEFPSANTVKDLPQGFQNYIQANYDRVFGQNGFAGWRSIPYYMKDNPQFVDMAMHPEKYVKALSLSLDIEKLLSDFRMYGFNHQGSKKFNDALDRALKAKESGDQAAFDKAMEEMAAIQKKNEGSTASKAAKKQLKKEVVIDERQKLIDEDLATFTDAQLANIKELENALKQKKGLRMTYEEANTGKENPMYAVYKKTPKYLKDENGHFIIEKGKIKTNPEYAKMKGYAVNCQTCTVIHELRMRGFNVEAISNYRGKVWSVYKKEGVGSAHEGYRIGKWLDQDGKPVGPTYAHQWAAKKGVYIKDKGQVEQFFEEYSGGKDGRFEICVDWKGGSAHVFCADRKNGKWFFFDPQSGRENIFGEYAASAKLHTFGIIRTDDKLINPKLFSTFIPKGEIPIVVPGTKETVLTREQKIELAHKKRAEARSEEQKQKIKDFWAKKKQETKNLRKELSDIISNGKGIEDAKDALKHLEDILLGNDGAITTKEGKVVTASIQKLRKASIEVKKVTDEFNAIMADAKVLANELDGVIGVNTDKVLKARSIKDVKDGIKKMKESKDFILSFKYLDDPLKAAKEFNMLELSAVNDVVGAKIESILNSSSSYGMQANSLKFEADWVEDKKKYKTWKVARDAYNKKYNEVMTKLKKQKINDAIVEFDKVSAKTNAFDSKINIIKGLISSGHNVDDILKLAEALKNDIEKIRKYIDESAKYEDFIKKNSSKKMSASIAELKKAIDLGDVNMAEAAIAELNDEQNKIIKKLEKKAKEEAFWQKAKDKLDAAISKADPNKADAIAKMKEAIASKDEKKVKELLKELSGIVKPKNENYTEKFTVHSQESYDKTMKSLGEVTKDAWMSASEEVKQAFVDYSNGESLSILTDLANGRHNDYVPKMDSVLDKIQIKHDMVVRSGQNFVVARGVFGDEFADLLEKRMYDELNELSGTVGVNKAYMSTSFNKNGGFKKQFEFHLFCPKGTHLMNLNELSVYGQCKKTKWDGESYNPIWSSTGETEIFLHRNMKYRFIKVEPNAGKGGVDRVYVEVIP